MPNSALQIPFCEEREAWQAELFFPWKMLGIEPEGTQTVRINISRKYYMDEPFSAALGGVPPHSLPQCYPLQLKKGRHNGRQTASRTDL